MKQRNRILYLIEVHMAVYGGDIVMLGISFLIIRLGVRGGRDHSSHEVEAGMVDHTVRNFS